MTIPSIREFQARGWFLSQEGLNLIQSQNPNLNSLRDYINCAKNMDLCDLATIQEPQQDQLVGPLVLQVVEIKKKKVAAALGGLTITFTDGHNQYTAAEILGKLECIKPHTPPGRKYTVVKPIEIRDEILVLGPGLLREEGGHVESLYLPWKKARKSARKLEKKKAKLETLDKEDEKTKEEPLRKKEESRVPTPALSETSQKKKKTRKNKSKKSKKSHAPPEEQTIVDTKIVSEPVSSATPSPIPETKPNYDNNNNNNIVRYIPPPPPPPPMGYAPPYPYYQGHPMYMDMMVPVMYPPYVPPPYMQPVYYVCPDYYPYPPYQ